MDIDYAVSWDHPFPTAFEQSYAVVKWVFEQCSAWNADPKRVSVGAHRRRYMGPVKRSCLIF